MLHKGILWQVKQGKRNHFHQSKTTKMGYKNRIYLLRESPSEVPHFTPALLWSVIKQVTSVLCSTKALGLVCGCFIHLQTHSAGNPCPVTWNEGGNEKVLLSGYSISVKSYALGLFKLLATLWFEVLHPERERSEGCRNKVTWLRWSTSYRSSLAANPARPPTEPMVLCGHHSDPRMLRDQARTLATSIRAELC